MLLPPPRPGRPPSAGDSLPRAERALRPRGLGSSLGWLRSASGPARRPARPRRGLRHFEKKPGPGPASGQPSIAQLAERRTVGRRGVDILRSLVRLRLEGRARCFCAAGEDTAPSRPAQAGPPAAPRRPRPPSRRREALPDPPPPRLRGCRRPGSIPGLPAAVALRVRAAAASARRRPVPRPRRWFAPRDSGSAPAGGRRGSASRQPARLTSGRTLPRGREHRGFLQDNCPSRAGAVSCPASGDGHRFCLSQPPSVCLSPSLSFRWCRNIQTYGARRASSRTRLLCSWDRTVTLRFSKPSPVVRLLRG